MIKSLRLLGVVCASVFSFAAVPSHAALVDNGGGLIYDTVLDITWAQPHGPDGGITWNEAKTYAAGLTLGGVSGWRLPLASVLAGPGGAVTTPVDCSSAGEVACRDNELGYMFYNNLGGTLGTSIGVSGNANRDLFPNLLPDNIINLYWTDNPFAIGGIPQTAWFFDFAGAGFAGTQGTDLATRDRWAWAVHNGNVSAVPVPAAVWLFGSGLLGLIGVARRKKAA